MTIYIDWAFCKWSGDDNLDAVVPKIHSAKRPGGVEMHISAQTPKPLAGPNEHAKRNSATGTRTRVARVRAEYPDQLDYSGWWQRQTAAVHPR